MGAGLYIFKENAGGHVGFKSPCIPNWFSSNAAKDLNTNRKNPQAVAPGPLGSLRQCRGPERPQRGAFAPSLQLAN